MEVHLGTVVHDVFGTTEGDIPDGGSPLTGVLVRNDAGEKEVPLRGLFYAIGHRPNTGLFGVSLSVRDRSCVRWHIYIYTYGELFCFCAVFAPPGMLLLSWVLSGYGLPGVGIVRSSGFGESVSVAL